MQGFDASGQDAQAVVKTIIALGRELDMLVTVEGVETEQQSVFLSGTDADLVQGFFFSKPIPDTEIAAGLITNFQKMLPTHATARSGKPALRIVGSAAE
jgi:EAL domain-containing protein (putative c-di-GMP-specific phosphodiesterase class I)